MSSSEEIKTRDGYKIIIKRYDPARLNGKILVIGSSAFVTQDDYAAFASFCSMQGFTVFTFDYRGAGFSAPLNLKGFEASLHQWAVQDMDAVLRYVKNRFPEEEIIFLGHGIGGEIVGLSPASQYIHQLILVNSAVSCKSLLSGMNKVRVGMLKLVASLLNRVYGYFPGRLMGYKQNLPKGVATEWIDWCNKDLGLFEVLPDRNYRKLQVSVLALSFTDDWRVNKRNVLGLLQFFNLASVTWRHLAPSELGLKTIGHSGLFRKESLVLWQMLVNWMLADENQKNHNYRLVRDG